MAEFVTVGQAADIPEGEKNLFTVGDVPVNVARIDGSLYAFSDICTHQGCNLNPSRLEGDEIECECHGSVFDVTTGEVISPPAQDPLPVYPVREEDGNVQIQV
jgi:3-phenylpropionate/trans-cinnamate dioxygenase ferredoxin component